MKQFMQALQPLLALALAGAIGRRVPMRLARPLDLALRHALAPWALGALAALLTLWTWGSLDPVPLSHDEAAHLLQAALLGSGHIVGPSPPVPEFFEQFHVFVTPRLIPKYPLGFPLALVPGVLAGLPALIPILLYGATAALLFSLARQVATPAAALAASALWIAAPDGVRFRPAYFSESLSGMAWLLGWWALLRWRGTRHTRFLAILGVAGGVALITRPLTGAAYVGVTGLALLASMDRSEWRLATWLLPGGLLLLALPIQGYAAFGDWRTLPYAEYSRVHFPADRPGLELDASPPLRPLPPDYQAYANFIRPVHAQYDLWSVPDEVMARGRRFMQGAFGWRDGGYLLLVGIGLVWGGTLLQFAVLAGAALFAAYAIFAHPFSWTLYYQEVLPVVAALAAAGAATAIALVQGHRVSRQDARTAWSAPSVSAALLLFSLLPVWQAVSRHGSQRELRQRAASATTALQQAIAGIPTRPAIVFLPVDAGSRNWSILWNAPDYRKEQVWLVRDRGALNAKLRRLAPWRTAYRYDASRRDLLPLEPLP